jgi:hypothetical protein
MLNHNRTAWRFMALACVAVAAVWIGASVLLSLPPDFAPPVLLR